MSTRFQACGFLALLSILAAFGIYLIALLWTILLWRWNVVWVCLGLMFFGALALKLALSPCRVLQNLGENQGSATIAVLLHLALLAYKNLFAAGWSVMVPTVLFSIAGGGAKIPALLASIFVSSYTWAREADDDTSATEICLLVTTILSYIIAGVMLLCPVDISQLLVITLTIMVATTLIQLVLFIKAKT